MVRCSQKISNDGFGISGYPSGRIPSFDANFDKSQSCFMSNDKFERDFLTTYRKMHKLDPGPIYKVELDMSKKSIKYHNNPQY